MISFIAKNWVNMLLVIVGTLAFVIYKLQERRKKIDAASLIILQIDEIQENLREISTYIVDGKLNETAFYESLPLMEENYWGKYKHYFVSKMDATSYGSFNKLYNYVAGIQEQQLLLKNLQKNDFYLTQSILKYMEVQFINNALNNQIVGNTSPFQQSIYQNFDYNQFLNNYRQQDELFKNIINNNAFTLYFPVQIKISLDKILKECSILEITGTEGYQMLKKISKKKF